MVSAAKKRSADLDSRARTLFWISCAVTLALFYIPYGDIIGYPLLLLSTMVHELGHGFAAVLIGANFHEFHMYGDGSGIAWWSGDVGKLGRAFVSAGGLCGPAVGAFLGLVCARRGQNARYFLGALGVFLIIVELVYTRNSYGLVYVGVFAAICLALAIWASDDIAQLGLIFLSVQLALSVFSRMDYLFMQYAQTAKGKSASDVQHMSEALFGPYWLWGGVCAAFSIGMLVLGASIFLRSSRA